MRQDVDTDTDRLDFRRGFVDVRGNARAMQHEPEREATDAAADDGDIHYRSTLIFASAITLLMRAMSDFIVAPSCSGELATMSEPRLKNLSFTSGLSSTRATSACTRLITASG